MGSVPDYMGSTIYTVQSIYNSPCYKMDLYITQSYGVSPTCLTIEFYKEIIIKSP